MRWCLVLIVILGVLVAGFAKVARRERGALAGRPAPAPAEEIDDTSLAPEASGVPRARPPRLPRRPPRRLPTVEKSAAEPAGVTALHGRVRLAGVRSDRIPKEGGDDGMVALANIQIVATDGIRNLRARASRDGRFAFHLPPGVYTLSASTGPWAAIRTDVAARSGVDREIDLELAMGAMISGRLRTTAESVIWLSARAAGAPLTAPALVEVSLVDEAEFTLRGLVPERRYDLIFEGEGIRTIRLPDVMAPTAGLNVTVEALPILRGAIGVAPGETCPIEEVVLRAAPGAPATERTSGLPAGGESDDGQAPDGACAFELPVPDGVTHVTVVATGNGWHLEAPLDIPVSGDPPPVCLNPPCANPEDMVADVVVDLKGPTPVDDIVTFPIGKDLTGGGRLTACAPWASRPREHRRPAGGPGRRKAGSPRARRTAPRSGTSRRGAVGSRARRPAR
jgi:hypothetical protein